MSVYPDLIHSVAPCVMTVAEKKTSGQETSTSKSSIYFYFALLIVTNLLLLLGENYLTIFLRVYPDLVLSVKHCVMTVADHCYSIGLITEDTHDELVSSVLNDKHKARILLGNVRTFLSSRPSALKEFVTILFQTGECNDVADKIQQQLQ